MLAQKRGKVYSEEMLSKCDKVLTINSEHYTVWNYRRQIVLHLFRQQKYSESDQSRILHIELQIVMKTLERNPKSYAGFHHRAWCVEQDQGGAIDLHQELALCSKFLSLDSRNFHCWDYRRFIVERAGIKLKEELKYSRRLIEENFSNYSAWHYRTTLIPRICKDNAKKLGKRIRRELEMVKNAFYTEPNDQSAWLYHRWLLGKDGYSTMIRLDRLNDGGGKTMSNVHEYQLSSEELVAEYEAIKEFLSVEPRSKWGLLTYCVLIQALTARGEVIEGATQKVKGVFETLVEIDQIRKHYYLDVKGQLIRQLTDSRPPSRNSQEQ